MKISRFFAELSSSYRAELDDLSTDSEGNNILKTRLGAKRKQLPQLLMMLNSAPEMVAPAFHGAFGFRDRKALEALVAHEARFPGWATLRKALDVQTWAEPLIEVVLGDSAGEHFLATTVGLEFLHRHGAETAVPAASNDAEGDDAELEQQQNLEDHHHDEDYLSSDDLSYSDGETEQFDLDRAGADFLAEQGFDRKE